MTALRFPATVTAEGKLSISMPCSWREALSHLKGQRVTVEIEREEHRRSNRQNRWYFGVVVPLVGEYLSRGRELPLSKDQVHHVLVSAFLGQEETPLGPAPIKTSLLTTAQFSGYCERIQAHAATEWGLFIPGPNEPVEVEL